MSEIVNKVASSGLVTIDLEALRPSMERVLFDISPLLVEGLLLREKDFRNFVAAHDWSAYDGKAVALYCSTEAIIPQWAWMLLATVLEGHAVHIVFGNAEKLEEVLYADLIRKMDAEQYRDQRVVMKGCSHVPVPISAFLALTEKLKPLVKSIMYGEPCSTVPIYKRTKD